MYTLAKSHSSDLSDDCVELMESRFVCPVPVHVAQRTDADNVKYIRGPARNGTPRPLTNLPRAREFKSLQSSLLSQLPATTVARLSAGAPAECESVRPASDPSLLLGMARRRRRRRLDCAAACPVVRPACASTVATPTAAAAA